ncbi:glutamyl-tRNA(Gln) amidotransferase subunit C, chloroplastic/mitochondrial [Sesamum indicum]|uniref:Glutamyl-tRNA(Gln) amidotransferase subunit C, chloroplastic/mitochondrial n=1 Tax=Sesamum indicum TaxID=4182 RepID=A0A6I9U9Y1_SESIN|nr:glutamyl-tRNA(Gln) amidotransferase subunit C, chloroplastic/mitochondrial [Sesamum indicum]XP_011094552.1 glutamyl-tRNA(Gln) amidotransferase subunit C, chloroplastic/mitochondrial [Sesamum indicum]
MGSRAALLLRATPPLFSFRKSAYPKNAHVRSKRFYAQKSSLDPPDVSRLAETARISLTPQEVGEFEPKIRQMIDWFAQLQSVDLDSVEPAIRADTEGDDNLRDDVPEAFDNRDAIVAAVPTYEDPYIKVPKVLNKE